jgi:hypothetical protein
VVVGDRDEEIRITENLHRALLFLRDPDVPRILWIDAVCIDQSNRAEKALQIPLMTEIYAKATRVIVWLGESYYYSDEVLEDVCMAGESGTASHTGGPPKDAVSSLLGRPWFQRIWVSNLRCANFD